MNFSIVASLMGGLGLFLLGMRLMTNGLRNAAGSALRNILGQWTSTPFRGLCSGFFITALVQSSSAITVAAIGFVNAGIITLEQSIGVIFGSNIGTTVTGWLVAVIGFDVKIKALALPLIGVGAILRLTGDNSRREGFGDAFAGFGLFFLGLEVMKTAFVDIQPAINLASISSDGFLTSALFLGIGFLLTLIMQSSSAAMALVLTASTSGMIHIGYAAAAVIGTNIGTTSTAALSVIGATNNAKKVAAAHIIFNLGTGVIAIIALPALLWLISALQNIMGLNGAPTLTLALFHTAFNLLGVIIFTPQTSRLVTFLNKRISKTQDRAFKPHYLDSNILKTPTLAMDALFLELGRMGENIRLMAQKSIASQHRYSDLLKDMTANEGLITEIRGFCTQLQKQHLPDVIIHTLPQVLRVIQYYSRSLELMHAISREHVTLNHILPGEMDTSIHAFQTSAKDILNVAHTPCSKEFDELAHYLIDLLNVYHQLKASLLNGGASGTIELEHMVELLEYYSNARRMIEQIVKGSMYWAEMRDISDTCRHAAEDNEFSWKPAEQAE